MPTFNISGGGGVNTKDATATNMNILEGKTAYVDKKKVTGTMPEKAGTTSTGTFRSGGSGHVVGALPSEGHYTNLSLLQIPVTNLVSENIKQGVNVGGIVGTHTDEHIGILTFDIYNAASNSIRIYDRRGAIYTAPNGGSVRGTCSFVGNMVVVTNAVNSRYGGGEGAIWLSSGLNQIGIWRINSNNPSIRFTY